MSRVFMTIHSDGRSHAAPMVTTHNQNQEATMTTKKRKASPSPNREKPLTFKVYSTMNAGPGEPFESRPAYGVEDSDAEQARQESGLGFDVHSTLGAGVGTKKRLA